MFKPASKRTGIRAVLLAATSLGLIPISAYADVVRYAYTNTSGSSVQSASSTSLINPRDGVRFMLAGGVDRKLRLTIKQGSTVVHTTTSAKVLGAGDVITYNGGSYYAEEFTSPKLADGTYSVISDIISTTGEVVASKTYPLTVDTVPPVPGDFAPKPQPWGNAVITGDLWKLGIAALDEQTYSSFHLKGVDDANGIASIKARVYRASGALFQEKEVGYSQSSKDASVGYRIGFFPNSNLDEVFEVQFLVTDKAGNTSLTKRQKVLYDDTPNDPSAPFGVYDPDVATTLAPGLKGFVPYVPGSYVKTNPIRLAWKISKYDWHTYREGGLAFVNVLGENTVAGEDATHVYIVGSMPYGSNDNNYIRFVNFGAWSGNRHAIQYNLVLHPSADQTPKLSKVEYYFSDKGWMSFSDRVVSPEELPLSVAKVRITVQPRPYQQTATHIRSCVVPANATSCTVDVAVNLSKGTTGWLHDGTTVSNQAGTLSDNGLWASVPWNDLYYPQLSHTFNSTSKELTLRVRQPGEGMHQHWLRHSRAWIENSAKTDLAAAGRKTYHSGENTEYVFDLKSLPEGEHQLVAAASENLGAQTRAQLFTYYNDKTAPTVQIKDLPSQGIASIDEITFSMRDDHDPYAKVTGIRLVGGPARETIALSYRKTEANTYALEYPILFPSLVKGEEYTISITAEDEHGNVGSASKEFVYSPPLVTFSADIPAAPFDFNIQPGEKVIKTEPLRLKSGELVQGTYDVYATLRSDATSPFYIGGVLVNPGATVTLAPHNFTASGGRVELAARPARAGSAGVNGILISTSAPNAPVIVGTLNTWTPQVTLMRSVDNPDQVISHQLLGLSQLPGNRCPVTTDEASARAGNPITAPVCLLEWTAIPLGLKAVPAEGALPMTKLVGSYQEAGPQTASYTLSVFNSDGTKRLISEAHDTVEVKAPLNSATFTHSLAGHSVRRGVDIAELSFIQTSSPKCEITTDEQHARQMAMAGGPLTCHLGVDGYPEGMQPTGDADPILRGIIRAAGEHPLTWIASVFNTKGEKLLLEEGSSVINAVHPDVTAQLKLQVEEGSEASGTPEVSFSHIWGAKTYNISSLPEHGTVTATAQGFHYAPSEGYVGLDAFSFNVVDETGMSAPGAADIEVVRANRPPVVLPLTIEVNRIYETRIELSASDANEWDSHTFRIVSAPAAGTISARIEGNELVIKSIDYWHGTAALTYSAVDLGGAVSNPASISVYVPLGTQPPVVRNTSVNIKQGSVSRLTLSATDADSPPPGLFEIVSGSANVGAAVGGRVVMLKPAPGWHGETSLTYRAQDDAGLWSAPATISIVVSPLSPEDVANGHARYLIRFNVRGM